MYSDKLSIHELVKLNPRKISSVYRLSVNTGNGANCDMPLSKAYARASPPQTMSP